MVEGEGRRQKETEDVELFCLIGVYIVGEGPVFVFVRGCQLSPVLVVVVRVYSVSRDAPVRYERASW